MTGDDIFATTRPSTPLSPAPRTTSAIRANITQEFFARVLGGEMLTGADRGKGRFRACLPGAVKLLPTPLTLHKWTKCLAEYLTLRHIARHIEHLHLIDRLEVGAVLELPDKFFVGGDFKEAGLLADVAVAEVIAEDGVAIGEALAAGHEPERVAGDVVLV